MLARDDNRPFVFRGLNGITFYYYWYNPPSVYDNDFVCADGVSNDEFLCFLLEYERIRFEHMKVMGLDED